MTTHEILEDHPETILVVDDSPDNLIVMKKESGDAISIVANIRKTCAEFLERVEGSGRERGVGIGQSP